MKFCNNCGGLMGDNDSVCHNCGKTTLVQTGNNSPKSSGEGTIESKQNKIIGSNQEKDNLEVQNMLKKVAASGLSVAVMIIGILYLIGGIGIFIYVMANAEGFLEHALGGLLVLVLLLPMNKFYIGRIIFFCNGKSKNTYMPTNGISAMLTALRIRYIYEIIIAVVSSCWLFFKIGKLSDLASLGTKYSVELVKFKAIIWIIFIIFVAFRVANVISFRKAADNVDIFRVMQWLNKFTDSRMSIFPMILAVIRIVVDIFLGTLVWILILKREAAEVYVLYLLAVFFMNLIYFITGAEVISINHRLDSIRIMENNNGNNQSNTKKY